MPAKDHGVSLQNTSQVAQAHNNHIIKMISFGIIAAKIANIFNEKHAEDS